MEIYLFKFSSCLAILLLFYRLFLEKENMHVWKRYYLIVAIVVSLIIPYITFTYYVDNSVNDVKEIAATQLATDPVSLFNIENIVWTLYFTGVIIFGTLFIKNLVLILLRIRANPKIRSASFVSVLLRENIVPHTFFNYIFFNKKKFEAHQIPKEVVLHEQVHAREKHTVDVLIVEIFQVIFWFHPLIYILKYSIKLNHEFLADNAVINSGVNSLKYQKLLLAFSSNATNNPLANAINYSLIKKRFTVMKTTTTTKAKLFRSVFFVPLLALLLFSFSTKVEKQRDPSNSNYQIINDVQDGASKKQIAEYNALAKKYNAQTKEERVVKLKDLKRLEYIYQLMTDQQKKNAEPFPDCIPPPPPPPPLRDVDKNVNALEAVKAPMPPPPPIPENATDQQKRKYKMALKKYYDSQNKYLKEKQKN